MNYKKYISLALLLTLTLSLPLQALAVDTLPPIPVSDSALRDKEVGLTFLGYTLPGLGWDTVAILITKKIIERVVDSTVKWINSGFEGNPSYVTDPKQYFSNLADGIAGEFIAGSDLNFLCSPFQAKVRLALLKSYNELPNFQCRLTDTVKNIEAFYDDFSQGGWTGWFAMTQNNVNNPYGSYLDAKIELDSRIAEKLGIESQKLDWGSGFLSWQECTAYEYAGFNQDGTPIKGACIERGGPIKTPGTVVESQLEGVLGSGMRKLELADEFDELVGALLGALLEKSVFSIKGLFDAPKVTEGGGGGGDSNQMIDIDGDGIFDGIDTTGDGQPDICFFGGTTEGTAGPPCKGSKQDGDGPEVPPPNDAGTKHANHKAEVAAAKSDVIAQMIADGKFDQLTPDRTGFSLLFNATYTLEVYECNRFQVTKLAAIKIGNDNGIAGLLEKTGGNRCENRSVDIIAFPDGYIYDVIGGDQGDQANPSWNPSSCGTVETNGTCPDRYRAP